MQRVFWVRYLQVAFATLVLSVSKGGVYSSEPTVRASTSADESWVVIPIAHGGQPVVLPVSLQSQSFSCLLASESSHHMFDIALRPLLGEVMGSTTVSSFGTTLAKVEKVTTPTLIVGGFEFNPADHQVSLLWDLAPVRRIVEHDIRAVLGPSFLRDVIIQFDFDQGTLRLAQGPVNRGALGTPWPLRVDSSGYLWVDNLRFGDRRENFQIRTGSNFSVHVHNWLFDSLRAEGQLRKALPYAIRTPKGEIEHSNGLLSTMSWGQFELHDVWIGTGDGNALGLGLLRRFIVTLDVAGRTIYLRPGTRFDRPDSRSPAGLEMDKRDGAIMITQVRDNSPAGQAGVRVGDRIASINGVSCRDMRLLECAYRIEESRGGRATLTLNRNGTLITVSFDTPMLASPELFLDGKAK